MLLTERVAEVTCRICAFRKVDFLGNMDLFYLLHTSRGQFESFETTETRLPTNEEAVALFPFFRFSGVLSVARCRRCGSLPVKPAWLKWCLLKDNWRNLMLTNFQQLIVIFFCYCLVINHAIDFHYGKKLLCLKLQQCLNMRNGQTKFSLG